MNPFSDPHRIERILFQRHVAKGQAIAERLGDESAEATLAGNPRRGWYLTYVATDMLPRATAAAMRR